jgi:hypothetical protein
MLERVVAGVAVAAGVVWAMYLLLFGSDAGLTVPIVIASVWGGVAVFVVWALRFALHVVITRRIPEPRRVRRLLAEPLALLLCFAFVWSGAAFWVRFTISRPWLGEFVLTASPSIASGSFTPGTRVGLFWLREAEVLPQGVVRLITTDCMFDDCGLVYSPAGIPPRIGEDIYEPLALGGPWYHWWRSW